MMSPEEPQLDAPFCPKCDVPMQLARTMPSALPKGARTATQVYECGRCGATATRTVRFS